MKIRKVMVPILFWVGVAILVMGVVIGAISDVAYLSHNTIFSFESLALMFGQVASPIWEGLALIAGSIIIERLYGNT